MLIFRNISSFDICDIAFSCACGRDLVGVAHLDYRGGASHLLIAGFLTSTMDLRVGQRWGRIPSRLGSHRSESAGSEGRFLIGVCSLSFSRVHRRQISVSV